MLRLFEIEIQSAQFQNYDYAWQHPDHAAHKRPHEFGIFALASVVVEFARILTLAGNRRVGDAIARIRSGLLASVIGNLIHPVRL